MATDDKYALIQEKLPRAIIVIGVFKVSAGDEYTYDDYGPDMRLMLEYMASTFMKKPSVFFPTVKEKWETDGHRGSVMMTTNNALAASIQKKINLVKKWPL